MPNLQRSLGFLLVALGCVEHAVFAQPEQGIRVRQNFNSGWLFVRQAKGSGELGSFDRDNGDAAQVEPRFREAYRLDYDDSRWKPVHLPHTWNAHDVSDEKPGYWRGIGWYRKHFTTDLKFSRKRIFLEFEGVNSVSEFWLNGQRLGEHKGGYTGFEFDVTEKVKFGQENVLAVKVDNLYHPNLPPTVKTDYNFYGGIYRYVWLRISEPTYISDVIWTTPSVGPDSAEVKIESKIANLANRAKRLALLQEIFDPDNQVVKTVSSPVSLSAPGSTVVTQDAGHVIKPRLWAPDTPNLYRIRTSLRDQRGLVDSIETPLGFRWFKFDPQRGFFLNGKRVQIQGTNWHQSYPGLGNALPKSRHLKKYGDDPRHGS